MEHLKSDVVAPDVNLIQLRLRIKEIEERLEKAEKALKAFNIYPDLTEDIPF